MISITKIQLIGDIQGYLETSDTVPFPVTFSVAEIRDITKRTGAFSKTITLPGTKNNNNLLGSYFDVNIVAGTYNVNKIQQCIVIQGGIVVLDSAYIQLVSVRKKQNVINEDDIIEYDVIIKDSASMFFTKIGSKELTDLPTSTLDIYNFPFTSENIVASFNNQYSDPGLTMSYKPYKYWMPYQPEWRHDYGLNLVPVEDNGARYGFYETKELAPAIYAKWYWDMIHNASGFSYTWDTLSDPLVDFDKLLITDNKKNRKAPEVINKTAEIIANSYTSGTGVKSSITYFLEDNPFDAYYYPESRPFKCSLYLEDQEKDFFNLYETYLNIDPLIPYPSAISENVTTLSTPLVPTQAGISVWESSYILTQSKATITLSLNWGMYFKNNLSTQYLNSNDTSNPTSAQRFEIYFRIKNETTGAIKDELMKNVYPGLIGLYNSDSGDLIGSGFPGSGATTALFYDSNFQISTELNEGQIGDEFTFSIYIIPRQNDQGAMSFSYEYESIARPNSISLKIFSATMKIKADGVPYNSLIPIFAYIPEKIKQSDFIKSISTMFNLYCVPDPTNPYNLLWKRRDDFYDEGPIVDWTYKLDRSQWQEVQFLPELTSKTITVTYKSDNDPYNTEYFNSVKEIYGQQSVVFSSEWVKSEEKKEIIFSPTPFNYSIWGGVTSLYDNTNGDYNVRIFYDGGNYPTDYTIWIFDYPGTTFGPILGAQYTETNIYPLTTHLNGAWGGGYDINFGVCDFYFMPITPTQNNLYNLNWVRTMNQLDNQKMLIAYFHLTQNDIASLDMSSKVRIDNSYWNINRIIDYDFTKDSLTKVELISIEDVMKISDI